tara:strand:+ start:177 stop:392 length:216 start_codon:yes stop_codon:yes gene_type:complete
MSNLGFDDFDDIQCEEYYDEPTLDELEELESQFNHADWDDAVDVPLFDHDGGLSADAQQMLSRWDAEGRFV